MIPLVRSLGAKAHLPGLSGSLAAHAKALLHAQMMDRSYRPTGWLGLLLGTRLYFNFDDAAIATDAAFMQQIDLVERELGERGKAKDGTAAAGAAAAAAVRMAPEGVPPPTLRSLEPAPAPAPVLAPGPRVAAASSAAVTVSTPERTTPLPPAPAPAPALDLAPAATISMVSERGSSFTPSMQLSSPAQQRSTTVDASSSMVAVLLEQQKLMLEREEQLREEAKADKSEQQAKSERLQQAMDTKIEKLREEIKSLAAPTEAISGQRLAALQARLGSLHTAKLLGDEELFSLEDMLADYLELKTSLTLETIHTNENASKLLKLITLSEGLVADAGFARQCRRKYV
jgi:hypothetical protein|eukprot:COSAG06_NODE_722_length_12802_cov_6.036763_7_plen_344_part_00